ncbi:hybrid sensor histidine kinase/response regulator [Noviherbaspirillum galbum]|uniref:histidine kinase n=1 Tax=Noviherbaspirillum galbum TaxID=2709383 RepID=A0A6B3SK15_9BURK|nr:response regulator [Noviherbaspirillum galbum]NEX59695.1 response regulator [Noviherbaspirillum galbum]
MRVKEGGNTEQKGTVLVVEDSPTQAEKLRQLLRSEGYAVAIAPNGRIALEEIARALPSLVVSDIIMPEMDGYDLCRAIKASPDARSVPVILVTSLIDPKDIVRGLESGADNFIRKPYDDQYLLSRIEQVLLNQRLRHEAPGDGGIALYLDGERHVIHAERQQILDLLISTYEQAVFVNDALIARERQVNTLNAQLAHHAAQLEATNAEIARKNVELERASRLKSEFLANMSHELRTPLNAIIGFSEAMRQGMLGAVSSQQEEYLGDIYDSGKHLLALINDILDMSKIEAGKMTVHPEPTDLRQLLHSSLMLFKEKAIRAGLHLRLEMESMGWARLDQRKVRQILYNLLSNAVKFTPDGGTVTLRACRVSHCELDGMRLIAGEPGNLQDMLEIRVLDTGIGIHEFDLDKLFQPFVQLDSGANRRFEGTGLGLALVKQFVELKRGVLALRSAPGKGSEFAFWLPFRETAPPVSAPLHQ